MEVKDFGQLLKDHPEMLDDGKKFASILRDVYPNEKGNVNLMITAYNAGVVPVLRGSKSDSFLTGRIITLLTDDYSIAKEKARWAAELWVNAYLFATTYFSVEQTASGCMIGAYIGPKNAGEVVIPKEINGIRVTEIGAWAFYKCSGLTSVTIPGSVTEIGEFAFCSCVDLSHVTILEGVKEIGGSAFQDCTGLTSVAIPGSVTEIGDSAFLNCTGLTSVTILKGVTEIKRQTFCRCTSLTSVVIPEGVTKIGEDAFSKCTGLTSVVIPESVEEIGWMAFEDCTGLTSVTIPESAEIGDAAFENTPWLKSMGEFAVANHVLLKYQGAGGALTIPEEVTKIGALAFRECSGLTSVTIPKSVTEIAWMAFGGCKSLTEAAIPESVTEIAPDAFADTPWLKSMGEFAVVNHILLKYQGDGGAVTIPKGVTKIGEDAFYFCDNLTSVTIPEGVTEIGDYAFANCDNLTSMTIPGSVTEIGEDAFWGCDDDLTIHAPAGSCAEEYARENDISFQAI